MVTLPLLLSLLLLRLYIYTYCYGVVFDFPASAIERFLLVCPPPPSNDIILAPKSINSKAVVIKEVIEFKLRARTTFDVTP